MPGKVGSEPRIWSKVMSLGARVDQNNLGQSQFLTNPIPALPLAFNLSLDDVDNEGESFNHRMEDNDNRLMEMLAAQAAHRDDGSAAADEDSIVADKKLPDTEKRAMLQKSLHMAASNGDVERVRRLVNSKVMEFIDVNGADEEGTAPLIYASCFVSPSFVERLFRSVLIIMLGSSRCRFNFTRRRCPGRSSRQKSVDCFDVGDD